ncbi:hypothetical protein ES705_50409 [subsurface metagenome]
MTKEWLSYRDRNDPPGLSIDGLRIATDRFLFNQIADFSASGKVREEWCYRSVLVPAMQINIATKALTYYDTEFAPRWQFNNEFFRKCLLDSSRPGYDSVSDAGHS